VEYYLGLGRISVLFKTHILTHSSS
jgi:hypothetical protein